MIKHFHLKQFFRVLRTMGKRRHLFVLSCLVSGGASAAVVIINAVKFREIVNGLTRGADGLLLNVGLFLVGAWVLWSFFVVFASYLSVYLSQQTMAELRANVLDHTLRLPRTFFDRKNSGEVLSRLTNDLDKIESIFQAGFFQVLSVVMYGVSCCIVSFAIDWKLSVVIIVFAVGLGFANALYAKPVRQIGTIIQELLSSSTQRYLDIVTGNKTIKLFNLSEVFLDKFSAENSALATEELNLGRKSAQKTALTHALSGLSFIAIFGIGALFVRAGYLDLGAVTAMFVLKWGIDEFFVQIGGALSTLQGALVGAERSFEILDEEKERLNPRIYQCAQPSNNADWLIAGRDVWFHYPGTHRDVSGVDLQILKNKTTAVVGPNGSGKTTLIKLMMGLYMPQSGEIQVSGRLFESLYELRQLSAYVPQNAFMFDLSIRENIRLGEGLSGTTVHVTTAARIAHAHEFILGTPGGYDALVGERGVRLSEGQRQRIALARAIMKKAPLLLLDEATASVDSQNEALILDALRKELGWITIVMITHRLATVKRADRIYVVDKGRICEYGDHVSLMRQGGLYKRLCRTSFTRD